MVVIKDHLKERMRCEDDALAESAQLILSSADPRQRLVVLVDQFEELFTSCRHEALRKAFIANLLKASRGAQARTRVLMALRADFYGKCAIYPDLARDLAERQELIGPMTAEELRAAIEKPVQKLGYEFELGPRRPRLGIG
jgi:hypothetical protein